MGDKSKVIERHARLAEMASRPPSAATIAPARCSFCSKRRDEVAALFEGPRAFICDECVSLFGDELARRN